MNNIKHCYLSAIGQINYLLFLMTVALLPFPQIFLRYAAVLWIATWLLEGRFLRKPKKEDWGKMLPFLLFGLWYLWKIVSGIWSPDKVAYGWQLERYMAFGLLIPIGVWGVNQYYDWKQVCRVLVVSCVVAAGVYLFTLYWVYNASFFEYPIDTHERYPLARWFFEDKISYIKHRLFLCSTEMMGVMAMLYIRRDLCEQWGKVKGWFITIVAIVIMVAFILATGSRASIVSGIVLVGVGLLYKLPVRHLRYRIALLLLACGLGMGALTMHPRMQDFDYTSIFSIRDVDAAHNVRLNIWGTALSSPKDYSLYGLGAGQSSAYLQNKFREKGLNEYAEVGFSPHNQYLTEWMEIGIPGMLLFVLAWISIPYCAVGRGRKSAVILFVLYTLNMFTDCMWGKFDGIALWCVWMVLIRLQSDTQTQEQTARDTQ